jgi:hypothetical protein
MKVKIDSLVNNLKDISRVVEMFGSLDEHKEEVELIQHDIQYLNDHMTSINVFLNLSTPLAIQDESIVTLCNAQNQLCEIIENHL